MTVMVFVPDVCKRAAGEEVAGVNVRLPAVTLYPTESGVPLMSILVMAVSQAASWVNVTFGNALHNEFSYKVQRMIAKDNVGSYTGLSANKESTNDFHIHEGSSLISI